MKKTVSLTSTILMTIYTALVTILNLGIFAIAAVFGHLSGSSLTKGWMVDGTDLGPLASGTSAIASAMILVVAFVLLIVTFMPASAREHTSSLRKYDRTYRSTKIM